MYTAALVAVRVSGRRLDVCDLSRHPGTHNRDGRRLNLVRHGRTRHSVINQPFIDRSSRWLASRDARVAKKYTESEILLGPVTFRPKLRHCGPQQFLSVRV